MCTIAQVKFYFPDKRKTKAKTKAFTTPDIKKTDFSFPSQQLTVLASYEAIGWLTGSMRLAEMLETPRST